MNFQVAAKPRFSALFILPKPSAMFDVTDHEALLDALQNHQRRPATILLVVNLTWLHLGKGERPCALQAPEPRWMLSPHHGLPSPFASLTLAH